MLDHFWDPDHGGLFTTPDDGEALVARQKDLFDNATPSANSLAAVALLRLAALTGEQRYANHADRILQLFGAVLDQAPGAFSNALAAVGVARRRASPRWRSSATVPTSSASVTSAWRPDVVLAWGEPYESPLWAGRDGGAGVRLPPLRLPGAAVNPRRACWPNSTPPADPSPGWCSA